MKHFNLLKTLLLLCALIVGSLSSWATEVTFDFTKISGFSSWSNSYESHSVSYDEATVIFAEADKNTSTITDRPVTKGKDVSIVMKGSKTISSVTFVCEKWGAKAQTITLQYSTDGGENYSYFSPSVTSSNFTISKSGLPTGTNAVRIKFSSSNQVGITSATIDYSEPTAVADPVFSPTAGAVEKGTSVSLSTSTGDANIYYTTDGSTPTSSSTLYENAIVVNASQTIKAIAIKGSESSNVVSAEYTIKKVGTPTFSENAGAIAMGTAIEIGTVTEGATIHYTIDNSTPTTSSPTYSGPITVNEAMTIKAIAIKDKWDDSEVASVSYSIIAPVSGLAINFETDEVSRYMDWNFTNIAIVDNIADMSAHGGSKWGNTDGKASASIATKDKILHPGTFSCYITKESKNTTSSTWKVQVSDNGSTWSDAGEKSATAMAKGVWQEFSVDLTSYTDVYVRLYYSGSTAVRDVDDIVLTTCEPITISAAGWATYSSSNALDFTGITTLTAYTATKKGSVVKFNKVTGKVPANTGLLVRGETANVPVCASAEAVKNLLVGVTTETVKTANTVFVLMKGSKGIGFYKNTNDFTLRANSAYLPAEAVEGSTARAFIALDDETTGIADVKAVKEDAEGMFDLQGRKVAKPTKGLYIVNGKKVVVK